MEAKKKGVKTGCRVKDGKQLCPELVLVQNDPDKYRTVTRKIFQILSEYTTDLEAYSIDEAFLDLAPYLQATSHLHDGNELARARELGQRISWRIKQEIGNWLCCSVGISRTMFLAKLLSDNGAKDSVTVKDIEEIPRFLSGLDLTDIWGINWRLEKRFNAMGVYKPLDLYHANPDKILMALHKPGYYLWAGLHGQATQAARQPEQPKSIGHSYCLPRKTADKQYLARILMKLCEKTGRRLREQGLDAKNFYVYWRYAHGGGDGLSRRLPTPVYDSWDIFQASYRPLLLKELPDEVAMLAVGVSSFRQPDKQLKLFEDMQAAEDKRRLLIKALDQINGRYGEFTLSRGAMWGTKDSAPDRIGFRKTVSWES
jgi:DNA polymerase-4